MAAATAALTPGTHCVLHGLAGAPAQCLCPPIPAPPTPPSPPLCCCICDRAQTQTKLYLVLEFINGGHLFFNLYRQGVFDEAVARLYTAEIVSAIGYLHSIGIMHRGACGWGVSAPCETSSPRALPRGSRGACRVYVAWGRMLCRPPRAGQAHAQRGCKESLRAWVLWGLCLCLPCRPPPLHARPSDFGCCIGMAIRVWLLRMRCISVRGPLCIRGEVPMGWGARPGRLRLRLLVPVPPLMCMPACMPA